MKLFRKALTGLMAVVMSAGMVGISANASESTSTTNSALGKTSFTRDWTTNWGFGCTDTYQGSMTVGFDTWFTDEDFVTLFGTYAGKHYAKVTNSNGSSDSTNTASSGSSTGKADIKHTGTPVTYTAYWNVS